MELLGLVPHCTRLSGCIGFLEVQSLRIKDQRKIAAFLWSSVGISKMQDAKDRAQASIEAMNNSEETPHDETELDESRHIVVHRPSLVHQQIMQPRMKQVSRYVTDYRYSNSYHREIPLASLLYRIHLSMKHLVERHYLACHTIFVHFL